MDSNYHVFKKAIQSKGKIVHKWYCYWNDPVTGVMHQKVCKGCKTQAEAFAFVSALPPLFHKEKITIAKIAEGMYMRRRRLWDCRIFPCLFFRSSNETVQRKIFLQRMFVVDGFYKHNQLIRTNYNKCGSEDDKKIRVVPLPADFRKIIQKYIQEKNLDNK